MSSSHSASANYWRVSACRGAWAVAKHRRKTNRRRSSSATASLTAGTSASRVRRSVTRCSRSRSSSSTRPSGKRTWSTPSRAHSRATFSYWRHHRSLSSTAFPLRDKHQSSNGNPFPLSHNRFPLGATSKPDNDNRIPRNDDPFPDNGNDRRVEFPVPGPLAAANDEEFADHKGRGFPSSACFCGRKRPPDQKSGRETAKFPANSLRTGKSKAETGLRQTVSTAIFALTPTSLRSMAPRGRLDRPAGACPLGVAFEVGPEASADIPVMANSLRS